MILNCHFDGIGSEEPPPNFIVEKVSVIVKATNETISFRCKFELPDENKSHLFYQVQWIIRGNYDASLTKQYYDRSRLNDLDLTDKDFEDNNIGLGVNITCAVRAFRKPKGQPGPLSTFSKPYFAGFVIRNTEISLRKGETKAIEFVNRVPLVCPGFPDSICFVQLQHIIPNDVKCSSKGSFAQRSCVTKLSKDSYNNISTVKITTSETGQYGVYGHFKVNLVYNPNKKFSFGLPKIWQKRYKLPTVNVEVFPEEDRSWRETICSARNDPHMQTFDNTRYEHHEHEGEYILYRHVNFKNVEIQHKIASCIGLTSHAKCNCGVAVRAGGDVYVINVCDRVLDIGYKRCGDKALTVKKDNDFTYTIYLPYGTAVRARIDNQPWMGQEGGKILDITVLPSVHDNVNSTGLCGSLNQNGTDDFKHRYNSDILSNETVNIFINSWKATPEESLFSSSNVQKMQLDKWNFPSCMCRHTSENAHALTTCDRSVSECTPGTQTGEHSCGGLSSARTRRSVSRRPNIPIVRQTSHYSTIRQHRLKKRNSESEGNDVVWTQTLAEKHCNEYFDSLKAFELCSKLPATHTHISVRTCALDIQLTNNTEWTSISRQSMQDTCTTEIHRNESVRQQVFAEVMNTSSPTLANNTNATTPSRVEIQEIEHIEKIVQEIKEITCLNNCSGNGLCENGICTCDENFGASDCSLDITTVPRLVGLIDNGMCDEKDGKCTHTYVFGEVFFGTNVTCRLRKFTFGVGESVKLHDKEFNIHGRADTLIEAWCPIEHIREKQSVSKDQTSDFAFGYQVSVSNDGKNFPPEPLNLYIYDSTCQTFENKMSSGMTFNLRVGHCFIEGLCVKNGTLNVQKTMICDTRVSNFSWNPIPTTTLAPATTTMTSEEDADTETFHIEIRTDITLSSAESLKISTIHQRYSKETKTALMQYYQPILGLGLKNIIINSLDFRSGSLKVQYAVIVQKDDFVVKALSVAVANFTRGAKLEMFGTDYSVNEVKIEDTRVGKETDKYQRFLLCESYTSLRPCEKHESCVLEKGFLTCIRTADSSVDSGKMNKIIIISSAVGSILVIIVFALVVTICCNRKKYKKRLENHKRTTGQNEYHDMNDTETVQIPRAKHNNDKSRGHTADQDNQAYQRDDGGSAVANTTINSRLTSGSYHE
ncbi:von Willebrand factor D and EGF domain-containing protein-like [Mercenaria mercenaria]|uniref:von Willebrand factor D and EGF domain-containing protein-like n=1 Tax=Mercenaria mercenaria TaxID=6596 RepID=UPI00234E6D2F|nr:von Willebrand factor D and EGF domain-containing protein-like [Mercenaria mercenaria]